MMMEKPIKWLPIDSRFLPIDFTLKASHPAWLKTLLAIEMFLAALSVIGSIFLVFLPKPKSVAQELFSCQENTDCTLAVRIDQCCDCPEGYLKKAVEEDPGLVIYETKRDYRPLRPRSCRQAFCSPCSFYTKAICSAGTCQGMTSPEGISE